MPKHNARARVLFCTGHEFTEKGPKVTTKEIREAPGHVQKNWDKDRAMLTADEMFGVEDAPMKPDEIPGWAHPIALTLEFRDKGQGDWREFWTGRNSCVHTAKFAVEYKRYDKDPQKPDDHDTWRFHYFSRHTTEEPGTAVFAFPFSTMTIEQRFEVTDPEERARLRGPAYVETEKDQCNPMLALGHRTMFRDEGYQPLSLGDVPEAMQRWVIHTILPIEFHGEMDAWMAPGPGHQVLRDLLDEHAPELSKQYHSTADLKAYPLLRRGVRIWVQEGLLESVAA